MAKRKRRAVVTKKTAPKRGKARGAAKSARKKAVKRATRKTIAKKTVKRAAVKAKPKKRAVRKKAAPPVSQTLQQTTAESEEIMVINIVEEPVPGVVVVTKIEAVETTAPPKADEGSGLAEGKNKITIQPNDRVVHEPTGQKMVVIELDDINERQLVLCKWIDSNGDERRSLFPKDELIKEP